MDMSDPFYVRQSAEPCETREERDAWFVAAYEEAREQGATWFRFSTHETIPHLRLVEGWKERPANGEDGEPRWALVLA
jgi:hypothetical protein